jgi:hypothetical protein
VAQRYGLKLKLTEAECVSMAKEIYADFEESRRLQKSMVIILIYFDFFLQK